MMKKEHSQETGVKCQEIKVGSFTMPLYHTPSKDGYDGWTFVYRDTDGKRKRVFRSTEADARTEAKRIGARLSQSQAAVLKLTNDDAARLVRAQEALAPTGKPLDLAILEYTDALRRLNGASLSTAVDCYLRIANSTPIPRTVEEVLAEFNLAKTEDALSSRHRDTLENRLTAFAADFQCPMAQVTGPAIDTWLRTNQKAEGWAGRTRNHYRAAISNLCTFAKSKNYLPRDWDELAVVEKAQEQDGEIGIFSPEDLSKLLKVTPAKLLPFVVLGAFAGPRPSEIQRADWSDLHWDSGEFFIGLGKVRTAGNRLAPLLPAAQAWLTPHLPKEGKGPVCAYTNPYIALRELAHEAGVTWVHDGLRHSFVSYRLALTKNIAQVSEETGTNTNTLRRRYARPVKRETAEAWFKVLPAA